MIIRVHNECFFRFTKIIIGFVFLSLVFAQIYYLNVGYFEDLAKRIIQIQRSIHAKDSSKHAVRLKQTYQTYRKLKRKKVADIETMKVSVFVSLDREIVKRNTV